MTPKYYWIYILRCNNGSFYTGYTTDLLRRYQEHLQGTGKCKYTRSFKPVEVAQCWPIDGDKTLAMKIERLIKKMSKQEKQRLVLEPEKLILLKS